MHKHETPRTSPARGKDTATGGTYHVTVLQVHPALEQLLHNLHVPLLGCGYESRPVILENTHKHVIPKGADTGWRLPTR